MVELEKYKKIVSQDLDYIHQCLDNKDKFKDSTILITGCAGFIGFYLTQYLANNAHTLGIKKLILLDSYKLEQPSWLQGLCENYTDLIELYNFDIITGDINNIPNISDVNYILHLASIASPVFYRKYPIETIDANVWGLRKLLDNFKDIKSLLGILFFSSSEIYGNPSADSIPTSEDYHGYVSCTGPRACYDEAKRFGETLCYNYAKTYNLPITVVRPFNNFGPGMRLNDGRLPADLANCIVNNKDIEIFSDGSPTRTFCYIADAIVGYLKALTFGKYDYFNIGTETPEISVKQVASLYQSIAKKLIGYSGSVLFKHSQDSEYLTHNPSRRCPSIQKAKKLLNYNPSIDIETGIYNYLLFLTS